MENITSLVAALNHDSTVFENGHLVIDVPPIVTEVTEPIRRFDEVQQNANNARIAKIVTFVFCGVLTALYLPMVFPLVLFVSLIVLLNHGIRKAALRAKGVDYIYVNRRFIA